MRTDENIHGTDGGLITVELPKGWIYLVYSGRLMKIGFTENLAKRWDELEGSCSGYVHMIGAVRGGRDLERKIHERFRDDRDHGEWFRVSDDIRAFIYRLGELAAIRLQVAEL